MIFLKLQSLEQVENLRVRLEIMKVLQCYSTSGALIVTDLNRSKIKIISCFDSQLQIKITVHTVYITHKIIICFQMNIKPNIPVNCIGLTVSIQNSW